MSDDAERLSPSAVRWLNRQLAPQGLRVCTCCQGHPQPLDTQHFYRAQGHFLHMCVVCYKRRAVALANERYKTDAEFRERRKAHSSEWAKQHPEQVAVWELAKVARRKVAKFAAVLAKAQS